MPSLILAIAFLALPARASGQNLPAALDLGAFLAAREVSTGFGAVKLSGWAPSISSDPGAGEPEAEPAAPQSSGLPSVLGGDARLAGRTFSLFIRREAWPRSSGQFLYLGGLAVTSAVLEAHKENIRQRVLDSAFYRHSHWTEIGGTLGLTRTTYLTAAALYLGGLTAGQTEIRQTGLVLAESVLLAQGAAGGVNYVVSEARPEAGGEIRYFHTGGSSVSIHMTNTMALARVLDHRFARLEPTDSRDRRFLKILAKVVIYSIPAITAWQRMRADQHYLWNVVLGAGMSAFVTDGVTRAFDGSSSRRPVP